MPVKFSVRLSLKSSVKDFSLITPDILHGFFFNLLSQNVAGALHKPSRYKPFCVWAPQIFKFNQKDELEDQETFKTLTITVSFLKDEYFSPFLFELTKKRKNLFLGPYKATLLDGPSSLVIKDEYFSFENLDFIKPNKYLYFQVITPISFKKGEFDYPLPDPQIFFKSLIKKWNYFSPYKIEIDLREALEKKVCVIYTKVRTYKIRLSLGSGITGFKGKIVFSGKRLTEEELKWLNILGYFSRFSGVGRKTTMSLGMVEFQSFDKEEGIEI